MTGAVFPVVGATPVTVNEPVALPLGMTTLGVTVAKVVSLLPSVMVVSLVGVGVNVMVPFAVSVRPTFNGFGVRAIEAWTTFTFVLPGNIAEAVAVIVVLPTPAGVIVMVSADVPDGIVTMAGIFTTPGLAVRLTT